MLNLTTPIEEIPRIGPIYQKRLKKLGIKNIRGILFHFPHRYEDFSKIIPISEIKLNEIVCVQGNILEIKNNRTWKRRMILTQAVIEDKTGSVKAIWFNQPYLIKTIKPDDSVCLAGKITLGEKGIYLANPAYEKISAKPNLTHTGRLIPVYPETEGLSSRWLRYILKPLLFKFKNNIPDPLPKEMIAKHQLMPINKAIWQIHFPDSLKLAEIARSRFAFEELFLIELSVLKERLKLKREKAAAIPMDAGLMKAFTDSLPFKLTDSQKKSAWQILKDLEKSVPMSRLLEGDVGSGKTVVAAMAALNTAKAGYQVAVMAPTEILAKQHFREFPKLLSVFKLKIALLTGKEDKIISAKLENEVLEISRQKILEKLKEGQIDILIGTHSLIQEEVKFKDLALVVVDEQHRFGVEQRAKLCQPASPANKNPDKPTLPHLLSMTATPIPRTLALTVYGDLDLSLITEMPKNRKKIKTLVVTPNDRQKAYDFIKKEVKEGKGVFVICPRIDPPKNGDKNKDLLGWADVKAVKEEYEKLSKNIFPDLKVGMLHGRVKTKEKEKTMQDFKSGKIDILVSTSVVEVGIDIPRATIMMIEGAERFGLAQLHQFRGRVGRSDFQSYCFLFTDSPAKKTSQRLSALIKCNNGFELAEKDLQIRGPGEFYGNRQWGIPDLTMSSLKDITLIEKTRNAAKEILEKDPQLKNNPLLRERLGDFEKTIHPE